MSENNLQKFQSLLRTIFQFDMADLDFGIYRIMNHKRDVIERFINEDLPTTIRIELSKGELAAQSQVAAELEEIARQISDTLGDDAIDPEGNLNQTYHNTPLGKRFLNLQVKTTNTGGLDALEASIYNYLITFFSRYYQDGDFISQRRYSKRQKYAIPYNGEEVYLYWANRDQYYIKTAEYFTDYTFTSGGVTVHFKVQQADIEQNNVIGDKRLFVPLIKEMVWDAKAAELIIPFEYRPLTEQEGITYGKKNQQGRINEASVGSIVSGLKEINRALEILMAERRKTSEGAPVSYLAHHLRQYTKRNTSDFFIHKDLAGFLSTELDFYLKNEVLNLDEMESAGEDRAEGWFQLMRAIKAVGGNIIDFLAQVENFQKMLWEKRKFITEVQYCITVGSIDKTYYPAIALCESQWDEWKVLFHIDEDQTDLFTAGKNQTDKRFEFLEAHPTLVMDTKHFDDEIVASLLASFDDLDELTDGLLIHSENYHALSLLQEKYRSRVSVIYIDPPYNTDAAPILYKNNYKDSSWLSLIENRIILSRTLESPDSIVCIAIDDVEFPKLKLLLNQIYSYKQHLGVAVVRSNPSGRSTPTGFSIAHDYSIFLGSSATSSIGRLSRTPKQLERYSESDQYSSFEWVNFRKHGGADAYRSARRRMFYPIYSREEKIRIPSMNWDDEDEKWIIKEKSKSDEEVIWPINSEQEEKRWKWGVESVRANLNDFCAKPEQSGKTGIYMKSRMKSEGMLPITWWDKKEYSATEYGTNLLLNCGFSITSFSSPKSVHLVEDCIRVSCEQTNSIVMDYYAGTGTTGHAVVNLNRHDGGDRKFILAEIGEYFDTVLLPRIKKIIFSPEWKDGKAKRMATAEEAERSPRLVKYLQLESYEDALNNLTFGASGSQKALQFKDYMLKYMLKWETRQSETLLNVEKLERPFTYTLNIHQDGRSTEKQVDIPETFNYLIGLHVKTRKVHYDGKKKYLVYRGTVDHREVAVIWRETHDWGQKELDRDKAFVAEQKLADGADDIYVNGDSFISEAKALEPVFKARMFAPVEA